MNIIARAEIYCAEQVPRQFYHYVDRDHADPLPIAFYIDVDTDATEYRRIKEAIESESAARGRVDVDYIATPRTAPYHKPVQVVVYTEEDVRAAARRYGTNFYSYVPYNVPEAMASRIKSLSNDLRVNFRAGYPPSGSDDDSAENMPGWGSWASEYY